MALIAYNKDALHYYNTVYTRQQNEKKKIESRKKRAAREAWRQKRIDDQIARWGKTDDERFFRWCSTTDDETL